MPKMEGEDLNLYETLHNYGMQQNATGNYQGGFDTFTVARLVAERADDPIKQLNAFSPAAKALWSMRRYEESEKLLDQAGVLANEINSLDEEAMVFSNLGRLAAVKTVNTFHVPKQRAAFSEEAVWFFSRARQLLDGHPHYYYRYANAHHGAPITALARYFDEASLLVADGMEVAFQISPKPYDQVETYKINPGGLRQIALATGYIALLGKGAGAPQIASQMRSLIR